MTPGAAILAEWDAKSVPGAIDAAARDVADRFSPGVAGVLFYGSCLRTGQVADRILDFYVLVDRYRPVYDRAWLAVANRVLPPNVFYHETRWGDQVLRSKVAVLSLDDLARRVSPDCLNVSVWARFSQPVLLLQARSRADRRHIADQVGRAVTTMLAHARPMAPDADHAGLWKTAFRQTYRAELRSEKGGKGDEIHALDAARYEKLTPLMLPHLPPQAARGPTAARWYWWLRRVNGKTVSFLRLIKAAATFDGGIDYLAWKIERHSGVPVPVTDAMRRHPIRSGLRLFWQLRRKGAFR
ncbi:hypothetical protein [Yunchengibacter salinarum]|uniref:hypothetical protein n=1 Tax=Yunchengibacter salinarum TaxID=3133399 RepID=UPI0035B58F43